MNATSLSWKICSSLIHGYKLNEYLKNMEMNTVHGFGCFSLRGVKHRVSDMIGKCSVIWAEYSGSSYKLLLVKT